MPSDKTLERPRQAGAFTTSKRRLTADVVVPTFHRPADLDRCLAALQTQTRAPERIIVVVRPDDDESLEVLNRHNGDLVQAVVVNDRRVLAAMDAGVSASQAEVIAFTDDDARPRPDWLAGLLHHLSNPGVGGAGGRDIIPGKQGPRVATVGRFTFYGRLVGNHNRGVGPAREVDVLKGVNMAFRRSALALPRPDALRGASAQNWEIMVSQWARSSGWRLIYDPGVTVDHGSAPRPGADRWQPPAREVLNQAYNQLLGSALAGPAEAFGRAAYSLMVGYRAEPGLVRAALGIAWLQKEVLRRTVPALCGKLLAIKTILSTHKPDRSVKTGVRHWV
ncbi:MAG: glycosyltransferase family 2 protein [Actinomycetota bacterium]